MEEDSGRSTAAIGFLRRGSSVSLRNQIHEERTNQYSNKPGNTTRPNPVKARWADSQEKPRYLRDSFHSSGSKATPVSSSKAPLRKSCDYKQRRSFLAQADIAESSNRRTETKRLESSKKVVFAEDGSSYIQQTDSEDSLSASSTEGGQPVAPDLEVSDPSSSAGISMHTVDSLVRNTASRPKPRKQKDKQLSLGTPEALSSSFVHRPTVPRNSSVGVKSSYGIGTAAQRRGLKNLGCTSISDVLPSGCSSSYSVHNRRVEAMRKRASDGESSSRARGVNGQPSLGHSLPMYPGVTGPRTRAAEQSASEQTVRSSSRNLQDSAVSVRTRRPSAQDSRVSISEEREVNTFALRETVTRVRQPDWPHFSLDEIPPESSTRPFSMQLPHEMFSSSRQGSSSQTARSRSSSRPEESPPQMFHGLVGERGGYRRINMEGLAEVLLALDRIEQDEELTYEQLLVLETNLFLGGLAFHDQHRDMRMDIDSMSYEELLALEERIGSVSTALSEEQFAKCLNRSVYRPANLAKEVNISVVDDIKCSICQEEYIEGEELGRLGCEHQYHVCCIHEWLRQKNWCPICKASATPS